MLIVRRAAVALVCAAVVFGASAAAVAVEMSLAGIKLGSPHSVVLKRYGAPTRITVGSVVGAGATQAAPEGMMPGMPSSPGLMSMLGPSYPGAMGPLGALGGAYSGYGMEPGPSPVLPGLPGMPMPGMPSPGAPGAPVMPGTQTTQPAETEQQVTWTYDLADGTTVEFIISETGHVVQITAGGSQPFSLSTTSKGIKLGSSYKDVLLRYGYPESQNYVGGGGRRFLRTSYADKHRCVFTFLGTKVVGVTVALKTED